MFLQQVPGSAQSCMRPCEVKTCIKVMLELVTGVKANLIKDVPSP
jgi:hypothetical protein